MLLQHRWGTAVVTMALLAGCVADNPTCRVREHPDGTRTLTCPDGSQTTLPPWNEEQPRGAIGGVVKRFGYEANEGIHVVLGNDGVETTTDASGSFLIPEIAPGWYEVSCSMHGWESVRRSKLLVLPEVRELEQVELKVGRPLLTGGNWTLLPGPDELSFYAWESWGRLIRINPETLETHTIDDRVGEVRWSEDGTKLAYIDRQDDDSLTLRVYEPAAGEPGPRWRRACRGGRAIASDGESFVYDRLTEARGWVLETYFLPTSNRRGITRAPQQWSIGPEALLQLLDALLASQEALIARLDAREIRALQRALSLPLPTPQIDTCG